MILLRLDSRWEIDVLTVCLGQKVEIATGPHGEHWLRFPSADLARQMSASLPVDAYVCDSQQRLTRLGQSVACQPLPNPLDWELLDEILQFELPVALLAGQPQDLKKIELHLIRSQTVQPPAAAIIDLKTIAPWVEQAPQARLEQLSWLCNCDSALVMGSPLPPILSEYLVDRKGVWVPAGWTWAPAITPKQLKDMVGLGSHQRLVWQLKRAPIKVDRSAFVSMTRASVRMHLQNSAAQPVAGRGDSA